MSVPITVNRHERLTEPGDDQLTGRNFSPSNNIDTIRFFIQNGLGVDRLMDFYRLAYLKGKCFFIYSFPYSSLMGIRIQGNGTRYGTLEAPDMELDFALFHITPCGINWHIERPLINSCKIFNIFMANNCIIPTTKHLISPSILACDPQGFYSHFSTPLPVKVF